MREIIIRNLYESENNKDHYDYSHQVELEICKRIFRPNLFDESCISQGYAPEWDVKLKNGTKFEIKIQSSRKCYFETHQQRSDGTWVPSGLSLSEAEYWIMLNIGSNIISRNPIKYETVGKLRAISTSSIFENFKLGEDIEKYSTKGKQITPHALDDIWIADLPLIIEYNKTIGFKLPNFKCKSYWTQFINKLTFETLLS